MPESPPGLHHVTAIAGDARRNLTFYTGVLGLRLVKVTVNYDDPQTYHLYYGDGLGSPGSLLTFFPWGEDAPRGRMGAGMLNLIALAIPTASLAYWMERLIHLSVRFDGPEPRFGDQTLTLRDPDGLTIELVACASPPERPTWDGAPVPPEHAVRGLHSVTLWAEDPAPTAALLTETLGFAPVAAAGAFQRFAAGGGGPGTYLDLRATRGFWSGAEGVGTIHHVAWRAPDEASQIAWRERLLAAGLAPTDVRDRGYFRAVYAREPGGALFEIATDPPGFTVDEPAESLGTKLTLPAWLEPRRDQIARALPPLPLPGIPL